YRRLRRFRQAVEPLKQAISYDRNFAPAHFNLALIYNALGDNAAAQEELKILRTLDPDRADRAANMMANRRGRG
ncbi:MAG: tetratricopeptide repeat protein, partial [Acidobacteria bacterium]|nr:tetratricopeptide repeat protein [Acidobacteriota bacterium]